MSDRSPISRRAFTAGAVAFGLFHRPCMAQGFAGLGMTADGFAAVVPGKVFSFPADHGPHPDYRIEWWYVTANLMDSAGVAYGAQWTLFRHGMKPGVQPQGSANSQIWMGHAAVTRADLHRYSEAFARGGIGHAGVNAQPFQAWIDSWEMRAADQINDMTVAPLTLNASGADFSYALRLDADRALVLEGDAGYSRKSERGQASYYFSQPYFKVTGRVTIDDATGRGHRTGLDGPGMEQPTACAGSNRMGLVLAASGFRRETDAVSAAPEPTATTMLPATGLRATASPCSSFRRTSG